MSIICKYEERVIPTYPAGIPDKNPLFFQKRVYQGANGKVYPVPFIDKVHDEPRDVAYESIRLENDLVRLVMLPEIGGRILLGQDKANGDYDFLYRNDVVKPALVGLAGPWISGGIEFNWPQHHRPATFLPSDWFIEEEPGGARTVWFSDHEPLTRMKGMHGVRLRPDSSLIEVRARLFNRTDRVRTFHWWANVAVRVHEGYESFFPQDVNYVADHAVRANTSFPLATQPYYGIDYAARPGRNNLNWYPNIQVPTSYMVCRTDDDFFGGYDHKAGGGFVYVANRHVAPGKKLWTWGDDPFGHAWDRELTDGNGPYFELMAGAYTDNQPDFTYLLPYETKTFSQFWWPIRKIGPVALANQDAALAFHVRDDRSIHLGLCVSRGFSGKLTVRSGDRLLGEFPLRLRPEDSWLDDSLRFDGENPSMLHAELREEGGGVVLSFRPVDRSSLPTERRQATVPPAAEEIAGNDELFLTGEHLEQYRHPTRPPEPYWEEALKRDPGDCRCHTALGKRALERGEYARAKERFEAAVARLTFRHPNPADGEAHYHLGVARRALGEHAAAYAAFYKATWNYEWRMSAYYQLATLDCVRGDWETALRHCGAALETNRSHNKARILQALALRKLGREAEADAGLRALLELDPLDHLARYLYEKRIPEASRNHAQTCLDLAYDLTEAGFHAEAAALLESHLQGPVKPVAVPNVMERSAMTRYVIAWLKELSGAPDAAAALDAARRQSPDYFFPSRPADAAVLEWALAKGGDPLAAYALGNFLADRGRHREAVELWESAAAARTEIPQVYRNLAIARWNLDRDGEGAAELYAQARRLDPADARLVSESDQLAAKRNRPMAGRLAFLELHRDLVLSRDDSTVSYLNLLNISGRAAEALEWMLTRRFHPWEGGEGRVVRQYIQSRLLLGCEALAAADPGGALEQFRAALEVPANLGEAIHPLQAKADVNYWTGRALQALGRKEEAGDYFRAAADETGDFNEMAVEEHSPLSFHRGLALRELGREDAARELFQEIRGYARATLATTATIPHFATSLPNLLVFDEDLQARRDAGLHLLLAQAAFGLGDAENAAAELGKARAAAIDDPHLNQFVKQSGITSNQH